MIDLTIQGRLADLRESLREQAEEALMEAAAFRHGVSEPDDDPETDEVQMYQYSLVETIDGRIWWYQDGDTDADPRVDHVPLACGCWVFGVAQRMKRATDVISLTATVEGPEALDWRPTTLRQQESESGWIAPDGLWYGCLPENHDRLIRWLLKKRVADIERAGWVRVYGPPGSQPGGYDWAHESKAFLTVPQENRLARLGHTVDTQQRR